MLTVTIVLAFATLISGASALLTWLWSRALSEASIGIHEAKPIYVRPKESTAAQFDCQIKFMLKNTGKFKAKITNVSIVHIKITETRFEQGTHNPIAFYLAAGGTTNYSQGLKFNTNQAIEFNDFMQSRGALVGEHVIVIKIEYESQYPKQKKEYTLKQGFIFKGISVDALTKEDYEKIKEYLPEGFQLED